MMKGRQKPQKIERLHLDDGGLSLLFYNTEMMVGTQGPRNKKVRLLFALFILDEFAQDL